MVVAGADLKCPMCGEEFSCLNRHFQNRPDHKPSWWDSSGRVVPVVEEDSETDVLARQFLSDEIRDMIAWDLSEGRYSMGIKTEFVQFIKRKVNKWLKGEGKSFSQMTENERVARGAGSGSGCFGPGFD